jgi:hypothetical protein
LHIIGIDAGFKNGSIAGLEWEANLTQSDDTLVKAQSTIADLTDQNDKLNKALSEVKSQIGNKEIKANITKLEQLNTQLVTSAANSPGFGSVQYFGKRPIGTENTNFD